MEFWGVEVKPGQSLMVLPEFLKVIHISQASLGEVKDGKGPKNVPLRLKVNGKDFVIGSLAAEERSQLVFDLVLEKRFELSHGWKDGSVYFLGYTADDQVSDDDSMDSSDSEDEPVAVPENFNHIFSDDDDSMDSSDSEDEPVAVPENGHAEPKPVFVEPAKKTHAEEDDSDSEDDDSDDDSEDDDSSSEDKEEELPQPQASKKNAAPAKKAVPEQDSEDDEESSEEDDEESSEEEEEEELPQAPKKRAAGTPKHAAPAKKAKPEQKKAFPAMAGGKGQQAGNKSKGQKGKAGGRK